MRRFLLLPVMLIALAVGGCAGTTVGDLFSAATSTITNPVSSVDIYRVKNVYAATLQLVVDYRKYCWSAPYVDLMSSPISRPICKDRRAVVRVAKAAQLKAGSAIRSADNFVRSNPTLNAAGVVAAAWRAVTDFQNAVPRVN